MQLNKTKQIIFMIFLGAVMVVNGQIKSGKVYYTSYKKMNTLLDSAKYDKETIDQVQSFFSKQFQKEYVLVFNKEESLFSEKIKIDIHGKSSNLESKLFKSFNDKRYTHKKELLGKLFSIRDSIKRKKWNISKDMKTIGGYNCNKATLNYKVNDSTNIKVEAWFTTQIPITNGPDIYDGLPGLILQLNDGSYTYLCGKIELSSEEVQIKEPRGGKIVTQLEFDKILQEKEKEGRSRARAYLREREASKQ
jgi:GLPGLI family protein